MDRHRMQWNKKKVDDEQERFLARPDFLLEGD
jgi:hypothetical protein